MSRGDRWLRRSMYLPSRWKDCSPLPKSLSTYSLESAFSAASPAAVDVRSREPSTKPTTSESGRQSSDSDTTIPHRTYWNLPAILSRGLPVGSPPRMIGQPLGNTRKRFPPSGQPQLCQHTLQRVAGGVSARVRNQTQRYATQYIRMMTLNYNGTRYT